jgi:hypothetical protein
MQGGARSAAGRTVPILWCWNGNALRTRRSRRFTGADGEPTLTQYASTAEIADHMFKIVGDDNSLLDMYQHGQYIASEPLV